MAVAVPSREEGAVVPSPVTAAEAAALRADDVLARILGFRPLPGSFFLFLILAILGYLVLIEVGKHWFYRSYQAPAVPAPRHRRRGYRVRRRACPLHRPHSPASPPEPAGPTPVEGNGVNASAV